MQGTDIMLANELDDGCIRSGCPAGALSHCTAEELSDHNALWLRCRV